MRSIDEPRARNHHVLIATLAALVVGLSAAAATLAADSWVEIASIGAPAIAAGVIAPLLANRYVRTPLRAKNRATDERLTRAKRALHEERQERIMLRELDRALDHAATEHAAIELIRTAFSRRLSGWTLELHLVDVSNPVLNLVVATGDHKVEVPQRVSPWDALAARANKTLAYDTTDRLDVCSHIRSRVNNPMAAVAVPLNATGRLLGVLYSFAPEGQLATHAEVSYLEDIAATIAARVAVLRSMTGISRGDAIDKLTGLPDRGAMQERVLRLLKERQQFTVAVADIDEFRQLNETMGREAGDLALKLLAHVARRSVRPEDVVGRIGGDELIFILPHTQPDDATRALERLREELVLNQTAGNVPAFTVSVGVLGSSAGTSIEEILHRVAGALSHAKSRGGNRVVVARPVRSESPD